MNTLEGLRSKIDGAKDISSVVKTMKAVAASNIGQYELAMESLGDYYETIALGLAACLRQENLKTKHHNTSIKNKIETPVGIIVFGSDQGLVGRFNDSLTEFVSESMKKIAGKKITWAVGERIQLLLQDSGYNVKEHFAVPGSISTVSKLVSEILSKAQERIQKGEIESLYLFYNQPKEGKNYAPAMQRLLPLDEIWQKQFTTHQWPTKTIPQIIGSLENTTTALIREYLFVSLFKACSESLACENASRLAAMQRAEKNIDELLDTLNHTFHRLRQSSIDEELFDVVSGFEALKDKSD
jgi:F-type H+-transporting ATPase subunit gamma